MMKRVALGASMVLVLVLAFAAGSFEASTAVAAGPSSTQGSQSGEQAPSMPDMMKMHEQMMAEMKAADARLDALVKDMNAATGDAKVNAVAAVVAELVRQQKSMHDRMGQMHQQMMGRRGMMRKK